MKPVTIEVSSGHCGARVAWFIHFGSKSLSDGIPMPDEETARLIAHRFNQHEPLVHLAKWALARTERDLRYSDDVDFRDKLRAALSAAGEVQG